jgi:hypothetical protein
MRLAAWMLVKASAGMEKSFNRHEKSFNRGKFHQLT